MRLIDAHALYREYQEKVCDGIACHECKATNEDGTCKLDLFISTAPTIDAVEVVRCKECKHWICNPNTEEWGKCKWISDEQFDVVMNDDDFCSYGEEAENAETD